MLCCLKVRSCDVQVDEGVALFDELASYRIGSLFGDVIIGRSAQKNLYVVPNHLTEQWGADFLRLYPNANVLVATKKDFEPSNRKQFCSRIATGDYDAIVIGHSQCTALPSALPDGTLLRGKWQTVREKESARTMSSESEGYFYDRDSSADSGGWCYFS